MELRVSESQEAAEDPALLIPALIGGKQRWEITKEKIVAVFGVDFTPDVCICYDPDRVVWVNEEIEEQF